SDIDDVSAPALDHRRNQGEGGVDRAPERDVHSFVEVVNGLRRKRPHGNDAGVVDQDVDASEMAARYGDEMFHFFGLADVAGGGADLGAQPFHLLARASEFAPVASAQNQVAALARELLRQRQAQAARAAGNEHSLAAEVFAAPTIAEPAADAAPGQLLIKKTARQSRSQTCRGPGDHKAGG